MVLLLSFLARKFEPLVIACSLLVGDHFPVRRIVQVLNRFAVHVRYSCRPAKVIGVIECAHCRRSDKQEEVKKYKTDVPCHTFIDVVISAM